MTQFEKEEAEQASCYIILPEMFGKKMGKWHDTAANRGNIFT